MDYHILEIDKEIKKLKPPKPVVLKKINKAWKDLHLRLFGMYPKEGRILRFDALSMSNLEVLLEAFREMLERERTRSH